MLAEWRRVDPLASALISLSDWKRAGQPIAFYRLNRDHIVRAAEIKVNGRRFAQESITIRIDRDHVLWTNRGVNTLLRGFCRTADEFFIFSVHDRLKARHGCCVIDSTLLHSLSTANFPSDRISSKHT